MKMEGYWFKSSKFEIEPGEDEEINPRNYGRQLALWLKQRFIPAVSVKVVVASIGHRQLFLWIENHHADRTPVTRAGRPSLRMGSASKLIQLMATV